MDGRDFGAIFWWHVFFCQWSCFRCGLWRFLDSTNHALQKLPQLPVVRFSGGCSFLNHPFQQDSPSSIYFKMSMFGSHFPLLCIHFSPNPQAPQSTRNPNPSELPNHPKPKREKFPKQNTAAKRKTKTSAKPAAFQAQQKPQRSRAEVGLCPRVPSDVDAGLRGCGESSVGIGTLERKGGQSLPGRQECFLEVFSYIKPTKKHSFGFWYVFFFVGLVFLQSKTRGFGRSYWKHWHFLRDLVCIIVCSSSKGFIGFMMFYVVLSLWFGL